MPKTCDPGKAYRESKQAKTGRVDLCYFLIPKGQSLPARTRKRLRELSRARLVFVPEKPLLERLGSRKMLREKYDVVLSLSRRGKYVCEQLSNALPNLRRAAHFNLAISRDKLRRFRLHPKFKDEKILVLDDTFFSGLTFQTVLKNLPPNGAASCAFLFGPRAAVANFKKHHPRIRVASGRLFPEDPARVALDFLDINTLKELARKHGAGSILIERVFKDPVSALKIIRSLP